MRSAVVLFAAGAMAAMIPSGYESVATSYEVETVTSCGPEHPNCPGNQHSATAPSTTCTETSTVPTPYGQESTSTWVYASSSTTPNSPVKPTPTPYGSPSVPAYGSPSVPAYGSPSSPASPQQPSSYAAPPPAYSSVPPPAYTVETSTTPAAPIVPSTTCTTSTTPAAPYGTAPATTPNSPIYGSQPPAPYPMPSGTGAYTHPAPSGTGSYPVPSGPAYNGASGLSAGVGLGAIAAVAALLI